MIFKLFIFFHKDWMFADELYEADDIDSMYRKFRWYHPNVKRKSYYFEPSNYTGKITGGYLCLL